MKLVSAFLRPLRRAASSILLTVLAAPAFAASVHGTVTDSSGAVVPRAIVLLHARDGGAPRRAETTNTGGYRFDRLPPGGYLLEAFTDSLAASARLVTLRAGEEAQADVTLELPAQATRIVVTSTSTPLSVDETAKALTVVDSQEIDARAEFSLAEALRLVPGFRVQVLGGPGALTRFQIRGLRAFDTSLLIDGFRLRDVSAPQGDATGFLGEMTLVNSDRVEVLRGSGSSLYGTHAIGGVVNMVTDTGGGPAHGQLLAEGGGLGLFRGLARVAGGLERVPLQYSLGLGHLNVTRGVDGDDRHRNSTLQSFTQLALTPRTVASARLFFVEAFSQLNTVPFAAPAANLPPTGEIPAIPLAPDQRRLAAAGQPFQWGNATFAPALNDPDSRRDSYSRSALFNVIHQLAPAASLRANYQGLWTSRDNRDGPGGPRFQPLFNNSNLFDGRVDVAQARADFQLGRAHLFTAGYEFEREAFDNLATDENPDPAARIFARTAVHQRSNSLFAQNQARLLDERLLVSLSGRWQNFHLSRPTFEGGAPRYEGIPLPSPPRALTGDVAVAWFFRKPGLKLRSHVGNAYRAPSLYERFGTSFFGGSFSALGDPRLAPERSVAFDGGFDHYLAGGRVQWGATYFYTRLQEVIAFDFSGLISPSRDPFGRSFGYLNTRGGIARGLEATVQARPWRSLRIFSAYTYTKAQERQSQLVDGSLRSLRIFDHMYSLQATQRIGRRLDVAFDLFAASNATFPFFAGTGTRAFRFEGPRKADLSGTYTVPVGERLSLQFFTRAENLAGQTHFEDGFPTPGRWATGGLRLMF